MTNEKVREEFEAWYWINYQVKHSMSINEVFSRDSLDEYRLTIVSVAYDSWQASRAALCVEFTKPRETDSSGLPCYDEYWRGDVEDMLDAAGVRYK